MDKKVDQNKIAQKLGLHRTTISRILNGDPDHKVSPSTRELIIQTAEKMKYVPRNRRTRNIALVVCGVINAIEAQFVQYICREAMALRHRVFVFPYQTAPSVSELQFSLSKQICDGVILIGVYPDELPQKINETLPAVCASSWPKHENVDWVTINVPQNAEMLANIMLSCGHRDIAILVEKRGDYLSEEILKGFSNACVSAEIDFDNLPIYEEANAFFPQILKEMLSKNPKPTALFSVTSAGNIPIFSTLESLGCKVPDDLSYISWVDIVMDYHSPRVTCLDDVYESISRYAVRRLLERIQQPQLPIGITIAPVNLRKGETCISVVE